VTIVDWGYINARMRGMKSRLLDRKSLDTLILQPDIESLFGELEKTPYKDEIVEAKGKYSGIPSLEYALRKNLVKTFRKVRLFSEKEEAEIYIQIFLERWDVQNIKTLIRGKNIHIANEEIFDCLVPVGELDDPTLSELVRQPDVRSVIDLLATFRISWAIPLTKSYPDFAKNGDLGRLENALDKFYYEESLQKIQGSDPNKERIRRILGIEIDLINMKTVLRMIRDHVNPDEAKGFLVPGGLEFDEKKLARYLTASSVEDALRQMTVSRYQFLANLPESAVKDRKISVIEKELERFLIVQGIKEFSGDPLSVASLIGYFWAKYNEITNIRIISRFKTADLPIEHLREELIYV